MLFLFRFIKPNFFIIVIDINSAAYRPGPIDPLCITMSNKDEVVDQKIRQLSELMKNPGGNEGAALRILHDLFQLTDEGRLLSPDNSEWVSKTACIILPPDLRAVLVKLKLDGYSFHFAALSFTDIEDVIDDLANNGEILKSVKSFPPAVFNKLKRELLGPRFQNSFNNSMMESTSSSPEAKKVINQEQPEPKKEEISPVPPLGTFLPRNQRNFTESPKEMVNIKNFLSLLMEENLLN